MLTDFSPAIHPSILTLVDQYILERLAEAEKTMRRHLDAFEFGLALGEFEKFFWHYCDDYLEIIKDRLYNPDKYTHGQDAKRS